jgi:hypothetical protein
MLKMTTATLIISLIAPAAFAQPTDPEVGNGKMIEKIQSELKGQYGLEVECDRGWLGLEGSMTAENCLTGMNRIQAALKEVTPPIKWDDLRNLPQYKTVLLVGSGKWQGLASDSKEIWIPYTADPTSMTKFINAELKLAIDTSPSDLIRMNEIMIKRIHDKYAVNVTTSPEISILQKNDGLHRLQLAMMILSSGEKSFQPERQRLGLETLVLGPDNSRIYEDKGELRMNVKFDDAPGKMFETLLHSMPYQSDTVAPWQWTYSDSLAFRDDRALMDVYMKSLQGKLGAREISCALDSENDHGAVSVEECVTGLGNVQKALETVNPRDIAPKVQKIRIENLWLKNYSRHDFDKDKSTLILSPTVEPTTAAEALRSDD